MICGYEMFDKKLKLLLKHPLSLPKIVFNTVRKKTNFDYRFLNGKSMGPITVVLEITSRCNLRCKFCWLWGGSGIGKKYRKEEMSTEEVKNVIDNFPTTVQVVYIAGGEPFVVKDIIEIVRYIKSKGLICNLTTNGLLINDKISEIIDSGLDQINVSIDGTKDVHDSIRGEGTFDQTVGNVKLLVSEKKKRKNMTPIIKVNTTITPSNYSNLVDIVRMFSGLGVDRVTLQQSWFTSEKLAHAHKNSMKQFFNIDCNAIFGYVNEKISEIDETILDEQLNKVKAFSDRNGIYLKLWPDLHIMGLTYSDYKDVSKIIKKNCSHPWYVANVKPNGDMVPCTDYYIPEYIIGNLKSNSMKDLWNSSKFIVFRKKLKQCSIFPGCRRCCGLM